MPRQRCRRSRRRYSLWPMATPRRCTPTTRLWARRRSSARVRSAAVPATKQDGYIYFGGFRARRAEYTRALIASKSPSASAIIASASALPRLLAIWPTIYFLAGEVLVAWTSGSWSCSLSKCKTPSIDSNRSNHGRPSFSILVRASASVSSKLLPSRSTYHVSRLGRIGCSIPFSSRCRKWQWYSWGLTDGSGPFRIR